MGERSPTDASRHVWRVVCSSAWICFGASPRLIRATRRGLRLTGRPLGVAQAPPELVGHWVACGWVALSLECEFGPDAVRSEREIRVAERWRERATASAKLGDNPDGSDRLHRPDLAVVGDGVLIAVEVELTAKAQKRLDAIVKAWCRARWVESVRYYVPPGGTRGGVERAVQRMRAAERVDIRSIDGLTESRRRDVDGGRDERPRGCYE